MEQYPLSCKYGKSKVHIMKIVKPDSSEDSKYREVFDFDVEVLIQGELELAYTHGDNAPVVPTDTIKNTCYVIAKQTQFQSTEDYAVALGAHFLKKYNHMHNVEVNIEETTWNRIKINEEDHDHCFSHPGNEVHTVNYTISKNGKGSMKSGISNLKVMKATQSGFEGYPVCEYTTLPPTKDRVFCTDIMTSWTYGENPPYGKFHQKTKSIKDTLIKIFSGPAKGGAYSNSVQETMYNMCCNSLKENPEIDYIQMTLPNIHHFKFDIGKFGMENENEILFRSDKPSGSIGCTVYKNDMVKEQQVNGN